MEELFRLSTEELSKICVEAEFDEKNQLILDEENCIHKGGIIIFKRPVYVSYEDFICEILDTKAIVKEDNDSNFVYMFAMTEIKSEETSDALCDFFESGNGFQNNCYCTNTHSKGWRLGNRVWEVQD